MVRLPYILGPNRDFLHSLFKLQLSRHLYKQSMPKNKQKGDAVSWIIFSVSINDQRR